MAASIRVESYTIEILDNHRIGISCETQVDPGDFAIRYSGGANSGEYHDLIIEVKRPMLPGEDAERPGKAWCFVCTEWVDADHRDNEPNADDVPKAAVAPMNKAQRAYMAKRAVHAVPEDEIIEWGKSHHPGIKNTIALRELYAEQQAAEDAEDDE